MKNLKENLELSIKIGEKEIADNQVKLAENFTYYFAWVGEPMYKDAIKVSYFKEIVKDIVEQGEEKAVAYWVKNLTTITRCSYNVVENSSGILFRETSTWKFQCQLEILELITKD